MSTNVSSIREDLDKSLTDGETPKAPQDNLESQGGLEANTKEEESKRKRTLTLKAKELKEKELTKAFWKAQRAFTLYATDAETALKGYCTPSVFEANMGLLVPSLTELLDLYEQMKDVCDVPDPALRMAVDRASADKATIMANFQERLQSYDDSRSIRSSRLSSRSGGSTSTSARLLEAVANAAARRAQVEAEGRASAKEAELKALQLQEERRKADAEAEETRRKADAEAEETRRKADAEAEEKKRKAEVEAQMDRVRREIENEKTKTLLAMEEAKERTYFEELAREEGRNSTELLSRQPPASFKESPQPPLTGFYTPPPQASCIIGQPSPATDYTALAQAISIAVSLNKLPAPEPSVFSGDPLKYNDWKIAFKSLIQDKNISKGEQIHYLKKYLSGPALESVSGFTLLSGESAFEDAQALLDHRYGDPFITAEAFRDKLDSWPRIQDRDGFALRRFSDFLRQCESAMKSNQGLSILDDTRENRKLLLKLPQYIVDRWARVVARAATAKEGYPTFHKFSSFISEESEIACNPIMNLDALRHKERLAHKAPEATTHRRRDGTSGTALATGATTAPFCLFCEQHGHDTTECEALEAKSHAEKQEFVWTNDLCFACLIKDHRSSNCPQRASCQKCYKPHPTSMHIQRINALDTVATSSPSDDDLDERGSCGRIMNVDKTQKLLSTIVPVWISTKERPETEHLVYALIDTMSDTTFVCDRTNKRLKTKSDQVALRLTTMTSKDKKIQCQRVNGLLVRGHDSDERIPLPTAYTRQSIPANKAHIPTPESIQGWPHLRQVATNLMPLQDCEVGLLIGYDCSQAIIPREAVTGGSHDPFALRTDLGWSVVGRTDKHTKSRDQPGTTHNMRTNKTPQRLTKTLNERKTGANDETTKDYENSKNYINQNTARKPSFPKTTQTIDTTTTNKHVRLQAKKQIQGKFLDNDKALEKPHDTLSKVTSKVKRMQDTSLDNEPVRLNTRRTVEDCTSKYFIPQRRIGWSMQPENVDRNGRNTKDLSKSATSSFCEKRASCALNGH